MTSQNLAREGALRRASPKKVVPDLLDGRQRQAAALLLCAVDLPAPMDTLLKLWRVGAKVAPGCTVADVFRNSREEGLQAARTLIDAMLAEDALPHTGEQS